MRNMQTPDRKAPKRIIVQKQLLENVIRVSTNIPIRKS